MYRWIDRINRIADPLHLMVAIRIPSNRSITTMALTTHSSLTSPAAPLTAWLSTHIRSIRPLTLIITVSTGLLCVITAIFAIVYIGLGNLTHRRQRLLVVRNESNQSTEAAKPAEKPDTTPTSVEFPQSRWASAVLKSHRLNAGNLQSPCG